jgi:hypothetical protein
MRWLAWLATHLLLVTIVVTGAHAHHDGPAQDHGCVACTLAHTPIVSASAAPVPAAPEPTREIAAEVPLFVPAPPLCAIPSSRAPPLA